MSEVSTYTERRFWVTHKEFGDEFPSAYETNQTEYDFLTYKCKKGKQYKCKKVKVMLAYYRAQLCMVFTWSY